MIDTSNLRECSRGKFFEVLNSDKRDVMPSIAAEKSPQGNFVSEWRTNDNARVMFGVSVGLEGKWWLVK